jgi:Amidase
MWDGYPTLHAQMGPMARTVRDLAKLLDGMVGYDPEDPVTAPVLARSRVAIRNISIKAHLTVRASAFCASRSETNRTCHVHGAGNAGTRFRVPRFSRLIGLTGPWTHRPWCAPPRNTKRRRCVEVVSVRGRSPCRRTATSWRLPGCACGKRAQHGRPLPPTRGPRGIPRRGRVVAVECPAPSHDMPATSQLDRLISITAISVLSWSRTVRHLRESF